MRASYPLLYLLWHLLQREILLWRRSGGFILSLLAFSITCVVLTAFAFRTPGIGAGEIVRIFPGMVWVLSLFSGVTVLNHSLGVELRHGALSMLLLATGRSSAIYLSKFIVNGLLLFAVNLFTLFALALFFSYAPPILPVVALLALSAFSVSALGTLLALISASSEAREVLLPVILFPLLLTVTGASVILFRETLATGGFSPSSFPVLFLGCTGVIAATLGSLLFELLVDS